jgi:hypothetical protein
MFSLMTLFYTDLSLCSSHHDLSLLLSLSKKIRCIRLHWFLIVDTGELVALLEDMNNELMRRPQEAWPSATKARSLSKAREHGFFLGMTSSWIEDLAEMPV